MDLRKYMNELGGPDTVHRGWLYWKSPELLPIRYDESQAPFLQTPGPLANAYEFYVRVFNMLDPADVEQYRIVIDRHFAGWYKLTCRTQLQGPGPLLIHLEWLQQYRVLTSTGGPRNA